MFKIPSKIYNEPEIRNLVNFPTDKNYAILGAPGTGKTLIAALRYKKFKEEGKKVLLLSYNKLLQIFLTKEFPEDKNIKTIDSFIGDIQFKVTNNYEGIRYIKDLSAITLKKYCKKFVQEYGKFDCIIVDEGQDIGIEVLEALSILTKHITILFDENQSISDIGKGFTYITKDKLENLNYNLRELTTNYRTPKKIFDGLIEYFLPNSELLKGTETYEGTLSVEAPKFITKDFNEEQIKEIKEILNRHSGDKIGILCNSTSEVKRIYNKLNTNFNDISIYYHKKYMGDYKIIDSQILVTTYKSAKGLEFDTVILNLPKEYKGAKEYNKQMFVLGTRTKKNLYLLQEKNGEKH